MSKKNKRELSLAGIEDFCKGWKVKRISVFGSILRKDFRSDSDVDVLLTFSENNPWGLFKFIDITLWLRRCFYSTVIQPIQIKFYK